MQNQPLVSAIIPAYNVADYLHRAIESVLKQTYPNIETIVVNDGSTDNTEAVARSFPEVRYFCQSNHGLSTTRNVGASRARGEYLAFLDADDEWMPTKIERQVAVLVQDDTVAGVGTHRIRVVVDEEWNVLSRQPSRRADGQLVEISFGQITRGNRFVGASVMVRKADFEELGGFDPVLLAIEDHDLWLRITGSGRRMLNLREPLYVFYERPHSLRSDLDKVVNAHQVILKKWDPSANPGSPLSPAEFSEMKQWWLLKDAFRAFCRGERTRGRDLVSESLPIHSRSAFQNALVRLAWLSPGLFKFFGTLRGYTRYTG